MGDKNKPTILFAEDEAPIRAAIAKILTKSGLIVLEAEDGESAREIYMNKGDSIDAILSDLRMPNMDGTQLAEFNYENRFLPFVVYTAIADAEMALKLLKYGVHDYLVKPIEAQNLIGTIKNALSRRTLRVYKDDDENPYAGNVGGITIPSQLNEIRRASNWIEQQIKNVMEEKECKRFMNYADEFLINAHEHGNLKIGEKEKSNLLREGMLELQMELREMDCKAKINVSLSVLKSDIAVNILDDGYGFNCDQYLNMSEETLVKRLKMPNGRGIYMATQYFDSIVYSKGGANVTLVKRMH